MFDDVAEIRAAVQSLDEAARLALGAMMVA